MTIDVPSPCRRQCRIVESTQLCEGCQRTLDEISRWSRLDNDQKLAVLSACLDRQQALARRQAPVGVDEQSAQQKPSRAGSSSNVSNIAAGVPGNRSDGCE